MMAAFPSDSTFQDTLRVRPLAEAFTSGDFMSGPDLMPVVPAADLWEASALNWILMSAGILLIFLNLRNFLSVYPHICNGLLMWKEHVWIEGNMRLGRERDIVAAVSMFTLCLFASRLDLFPSGHLAAMTPGIKTLAVLAIFYILLIFRGMLILAAPFRKIRQDIVRAANHVAFNFIIVANAIFSILAIIYSVSDGCATFAHNAAYWAAGVLLPLLLLRKCQIISSANGQFTAILYLCMIEILPVGLLIATMIYLQAGLGA